MLYAIGDLHLSGASNKPMDIFGGGWKNHTARIVENWNRVIDAADVVIINGDVSWAMSEDELKPDMELIRSLPGKKIISLGNHDYWFDSATKFHNAYPEIELLIKGNCLKYEDFHICGTRGWLCPDAQDFGKEDLRVYNRELQRLKASLDAAMKDGAKDIICILHYPPFVHAEAGSGFLDLIRAYPVKRVVYAHLHGESCRYAHTGMIGGVEYILTSADHLGFAPKRVL